MRTVTTMPTIVTTCRRCGREFSPDRGAIAAGAWRLCPACRGEGGDPGALPEDPNLGHNREALALVEAFRQESA